MKRREKTDDNHDGFTGEYQRCNRRGSPNWRCRERALEGKTLCVKHYFYVMQRSRMKKMEERESQNGSRVEVGERTKRQKNTENVGFGGEDGNTGDLGCFSEERGVNSSQSFQLWDGGQVNHQLQGRESQYGSRNEVGLQRKGQNNHGGDCQMEAGKSEGLGFGDQGCNSDVVGWFNVDGRVKSSQNLQPWDGGQGNHQELGPACGVFVGNAKESEELQVNVKCFEGTIENSERIEGIFGEISGGSGGFGDGIETLLGEMDGGGDRTFGSYGNECWCGEPGCASLDGNGIHGLFGEIAVNGDSNCDGIDKKMDIVPHEGIINEGLNEIGSRSRGRGRPKGSKNKKRVNVTQKGILIEGLNGIGGDSNGDESVKPKERRGRPKGSKNKPKEKKNDQEGRNVGNDIICGEFGSDSHGMYLGDEMALDLGKEEVEGMNENEISQTKGKRGRPKGSKNKKKKSTVSVENEDMQSESDGGFGDVEVKRRCGQPKGSMKGETSIGNEEGKEKSQGDEIVRIISVVEESVSEIIKPTPRIGRPKGSKNKRKILFGEDLNRILVQKDRDQTLSDQIQEEKGKNLKEGKVVVQKRPRGRPKQFVDQSENSGSLVSSLNLIDLSFSYMKPI